MTTTTTGNRAVFLDRDGTINIEKDYLFRPEEFEFIPGVPDAIRLLNEHGFKVIVVTNQSGIGRGYYTESDMHLLHRHLDTELAAFAAHIDAYYFCPHHPEEAAGKYKRECSCRKPLDGMLRQAAGDYAIDLGGSYIIGDKVADISAGIAAGCKPLLVLTGHGEKHAPLLPQGVPVFPDMPAAVGAILAGKV
jgi:D-glycero-D-manno-heptose 1,7-bisphosphate phosphatase